MDGFFSINFPKPAKTRRKRKIVRCRSELFFGMFSYIYTRNNALSYKFVCTSAAFHLKRVPGTYFSVNLIKFKRALSRIFDDI